MELSGHNCLFEHANVVIIGVKTSEFLKIVVKLYFFENFGD